MRDQAERRSVRKDDAGSTGGHRSRGEDRGRRAAAVFRSRYAPGAVPGVSDDRRHRPHAFAVRDGMGAGAREIPCFGTTHADYFHGPVPVTDPMPAEEIESDYELNTGVAIVRRFSNLSPIETPAVLVAGHAPFCWGPTPADAAHTAVIVEEIANMAFLTVSINAHAEPLPDHLRDKHFLRKHGSTAYYGQPR